SRSEGSTPSRHSRSSSPPRSSPAGSSTGRSSAGSCARPRRRASRTPSSSASGWRWRSRRRPSVCGRRTSARSRRAMPAPSSPSPGWRCRSCAWRASRSPWRSAAGSTWSSRGGAGAVRGGERDRVRRPVSRGRGSRRLLRRPRGPPARAVRSVTGRRSRALGLATAAALATVPLVVRRDDVLNFLFLVLLSVTLAESWNIVAGYAGQVNLGHAAFFGLGALTTRALWIAGAPVLGAMVAGAAVAVGFALLIGAAAFRLRGAYFAIGTLALGEILRITVGNVRAEISTLPAATIAGYRLAHRYYLALALAAAAVAVVAALGGSRLGLGMRAIREHEESAEARGVRPLRLKLLALALSTPLAGLAGGLFAYYHISYYPAHPFSPTWTFDALLITFIGGVGTVHGPVLGAVFYVFLKEYLAIRWVDF